MSRTAALVPSTLVAGVLAVLGAQGAPAVMTAPARDPLPVVAQAAADRPALTAGRRRAPAAMAPRRQAARPRPPQRVRPAPRPVAPASPPPAARPPTARQRLVALRVTAPAGPTSWPALNSAIARIPSYHGTGATWVVHSSDGYWGTADLATATIYIGPQVPLHRLYDVAVHEWSHVLSVAVYGGDVTAATEGMNAFFGGSGLVGAERAADCMARLEGASWTAYTPCHDRRWREGAARLLRGRRL